MKIIWLGHSCFLLILSNGAKVVADPFYPEDPLKPGLKLHYRLPVLSADFVLVSHEHFDHSASDLIQGNPTVLNGPGQFSCGELTGEAILADHDDCGGERSGKTLIFTWETERMRFCHLGDVGQRSLRQEQLRSIVPVDVLFIPVGGKFTIGPNEAVNYIRQLEPKVVVPMHYKTRMADFLEYGIEEFIDVCLAEGIRAIGTGAPALEITPSHLNVLQGPEVRCLLYAPEYLVRDLCQSG
ncbi:MAG TPA: MBL fold metallo-hydrolase [Clostridia bacterium]|nr:MBL fold metallo-hydrolase [Clostridia bacterium]